MKIRIRLAAVAAAALTAASATQAAAQISNHPYDFPGPGSPGMSIAAREAVILNEIDPGFTPEFLLRATTGGLLTPIPLPNGSDVPLVLAPGLFLVTSYDGRPRMSGDSLFGAGVFNPYFSGDYESSRDIFYPVVASSISVWTARVMGDRDLGYGADAITDWTLAAYLLGGAR